MASADYYSNEVIDTDLTQALSNIKNYFKRDDVTVEQMKAAESFLSKYMASINSNYVLGAAVLQSYNSMNSDYVKDILDNHGDYDSTEISRILYDKIFYSLFKYNADAAPGNRNEAYKTHELLDGSIFSEKSDAEIGNYYCFNSSNSFFKYLSEMLGDSWQSSETKFVKSGWFSRKTETINLVTLLTTGYHEYDGEKYPIFKTKEDIKKFVFTAIYYKHQTINPTSSYSFEITFTDSLQNALKDSVLQEIRDLVTKAETNSSDENNVDKEYDFSNFVVRVRNASEYVDFYYLLYNKGVDLLKLYIEKYKEVKGSNTTSNNLKKDDYIEKLFNTLVGYSGSKFSEQNGSYCFDHDNKGSGILNELTKAAKISSSAFASITEDWKENFNKNKTFEMADYRILTTERNSAITSKLVNFLKSNSEYFVPFCFYEKVIFKNYKAQTRQTLEEYESDINNFCRISGSIISKFVFLSIFNINSKVAIGSSDEALYVGNFTATKKYTYEDKIIEIIDEDTGAEPYSKYSDAYKKLGTKLVNDLLELLQETISAAEKEETTKVTLENQSSFDEYVKSRISDNYFTEKSYFYINDSTGKKRIPFNPFVDIEFRVPDYNSESESSTVWIPVTSTRTEKTRENNDFVLNENSEEYTMREMHAGSYFESFELNDKGNDTKEISLVLKSVNDMNLENIIYNSLAVDNATIKIKGNTSEISDIQQMLNDTESNFRIRFGYRDLAANDENNNETAVITSKNTDQSFINRTKTSKSGDKTIVKPVLVYPWTYFKITGLSSNIINGEDTYTITAVSSGSYIFSNMSLSGLSSETNFTTDKASDFYGTPRNVLGKIIKWITYASSDNDDVKTARICFLGDEDGKIVTDFDGTNFSGVYNYTTPNGSKIKGGNIQSVEEFFFDGTKSNLLNAKNFNIVNDSKTLSIKEILNNLASWLPSRVYYIAKDSQQRTVAINLPYNSIYNIKDFFSSVPFKIEAMTYQVIEADNVSIDGGTAHKVYFIRMYYAGPGLSADEDGKASADEYLRVYNYRSTQEQVIENIDISSSNDAELGNTISSVTLLGGSCPIMFTFNDDTGLMGQKVTSVLTGADSNISDASNASKENNGITEGGKFSAWFSPASGDSISPKLILNNSKYKIVDIDDKENLNPYITNSSLEAALFFSDQQNKQYEGEITILGDPFYYFDSSLEAGKYEIYLQMNRVAKRKNYKVTPSRYSGIYFIKGIKHSIDSSGKYTTTLSVAKRVFGSGTSTT
jgi:hypothetical protein